MKYSDQYSKVAFVQNLEQSKTGSTTTSVVVLQQV